jgi:hypothetical protein
MSDETEAVRGEAAWKQQREAVAKRNAEAHRRGQAERKLHDRSIDARARVRAAREAEELHQLNAELTKRRAGGRA